MPQRGLGLGDHRSAAEPRQVADRRLVTAQHLGPEPGRLGHLAAQVEHGGRRHRPHAEQDPPYHVITAARAEQHQGEQRADDKARRLGREHHPEQPPPVLAVGVLAHQHRADWVVTTDPKSQHDAEDDQYPERWRQRGTQRTGHHDHRDQPAHPLPADQVGDPAQRAGAHHGGGQHDGIEQGHPAGTQLPLLLDQGGGDANDEQVIGVGEEAHAADHDGAKVEPADRRLVQGTGQGHRAGCGHQLSGKTI